MNSRGKLSWIEMNRLSEDIGQVRNFVCDYISAGGVKVTSIYPCLGLSRSSFYWKLRNRKFNGKELVTILDELLKSNTQIK